MCIFRAGITQEVPSKQIFAKLSGLWKKCTVFCGRTARAPHPKAPCQNGVDLRETRSGSRVGFRQIAMPTETLGESRYVKPTPFATSQADFTPLGYLISIYAVPPVPLSLPSYCYQSIEFNRMITPRERRHRG